MDAAIDCRPFGLTAECPNRMWFDPDERPIMERSWEILFDWKVEISSELKRTTTAIPNQRAGNNSLRGRCSKWIDYFSIESIPFFLNGIFAETSFVQKESQHEVQEGGIL